MQNLEKYARPVLRVAMALVFLYFGFQEVTNPEAWVGFVPDFALVFGLKATTILLINAILELGLGALMILGLFTRIVSLILSLHLFVIAASLGFNDLAVRDFGLAFATLAVFLGGADALCLDKKFEKTKAPETSQANQTQKL